MTLLAALFDPVKIWVKALLKQYFSYQLLCNKLLQNFAL